MFEHCFDHFENQNDSQNEPKNNKNDARNVTEKKKHSPRLQDMFLHEFYETMALVFLKISEILDTIDKLYISSFFVIHPCKPPK